MKRDHIPLPVVHIVAGAGARAICLMPCDTQPVEIYGDLKDLGFRPLGCLYFLLSKHQFCDQSMPERRERGKGGPPWMLFILSARCESSQGRACIRLIVEYQIH